MKIKTSAIPEWFYNSDCFKLETDQNNKNYNSVKQRLYDYTNYPRFTAPSNKIAGHPEYNFVDLLKIQNNTERRDPGEKVGYNIFPKRADSVGFSLSPTTLFNAYTKEQNYAFKGESGDLNNNTLDLDATDEKYQYVNGERAYGNYINEEQEKLMCKFLEKEHNKEKSKNSKISTYALNAFQTLDKFFYLDTQKDILCDYLINPPKSIMADACFDFLMEDIYCLYHTDSFYLIAWGIFEIKLARRKYELTKKEVFEKFFFLLWSHSEFYGINFFYKKNDGTVINRGEKPSGGNPGDSKAPANALYNYATALAAITIGDGLLHFMDALYSWGEFTNSSGEKVDLENLSNFNVSAPYRFSFTPESEIGYGVRPAIIWVGVNQYVSLAIWHAYQNKDIIENTEFKWETPDFIYGTTRRTGNEKQIPYNLLYQEPTVELKYYNNPTTGNKECLIYVCNFNSKEYKPKMLTVFAKDKNNNEVKIPILIKGKKAELVRVTF